MSRRLPFFVYGTLIPGLLNERKSLAASSQTDLVSNKGEPNEKHFKNKIVSYHEAVLRGARLYRFPGYPMMVINDEKKDDADNVVRGVVVYVDDDSYQEVLTSLDALEEYDPSNISNSLYLRIERQVELLDDATSSSSKVNCFTYCGSQEQVNELPRVEDNDWRAEIRRDSSARAWWLHNTSARPTEK